MLKNAMLIAASFLVLSGTAMAQTAFSDQPETLEIISSFRYTDKDSNMLATNESTDTYYSPYVTNFLFAKDFDHTLTYQCYSGLLANKSDLAITIDLKSTSRAYSANSMNNWIRVVYKMNGRGTCGRYAARLAEASPEHSIFITIDFKNKKILDLGVSDL